uniref:Uncharacterized protein n=1 Tax=Burkholderia phage vB_BgluM-SURPRISE13 TaxID=3159457 RepID=A0AAU7PFI4_9VIRU
MNTNPSVAAFGDMRTMYIAERNKGKSTQAIEELIIRSFPKIPIREVAAALSILNKEHEREATRC